MQDAIFIAKKPVGSAKKKNLLLTCRIQRQVCSVINILLNSNYHLNAIDKEAAVDLGLQSVKKYWRSAAQVANEHSYLQDILPALAIFVNKAYKD